MKRPMLVALLCMTAVACGRKQSDRDADQQKDPAPQTNPGPNPTGPGSSNSQAQVALPAEIVADTQLSNEIATDEIDQATTDLASIVNDQDLQAGLGLTPRLDRQRSFEKSCNAQEDGSALVSIEKSFSASFSRENIFMSAAHSLELSETKTRTWSQEGTALACTDNGRSVDLADINGAGLKLDVQYTRSKKVHHEQNRIHSRSQDRDVKAQGSRSVLWSQDDDDGQIISRALTLTTSYQRDVVVSNRQGEQRQLSFNGGTDAENPLVIQVQRKSADKSFISATIASGKLIRSNSKGLRVETTFVDVTYTANSRCAATSGSITGAFYQDGEEQPVKTYTLTFADGQAQISYDGGEPQDWDPAGCDLEDKEI